MTDNILLCEERDGVILLTLNRPEVMNSLNFALLHALRNQIEALRFNPDVRVIIITGAGDRAFCAGADLKERATLSPLKVKEYIFTISVKSSGPPVRFFHPLLCCFMLHFSPSFYCFLTGPLIVFLLKFFSFFSFSLSQFNLS